MKMFLKIIRPLLFFFRTKSVQNHISTKSYQYKIISVRNHISAKYYFHLLNQVKTLIYFQLSQQSLVIRKMISTVTKIILNKKEREREEVC